MSESLLELIHQNCSYVRDVRKINGYIYVQILDNPDNEISWIPLYEASIPVEKIIKKWISLGGEIKERK
jgi:hypothetical protein